MPAKVLRRKRPPEPPKDEKPPEDDGQDKPPKDDTPPIPSHWMVKKLW